MVSEKKSTKEENSSLFKTSTIVERQKGRSKEPQRNRTFMNSISDNYPTSLVGSLYSLGTEKCTKKVWLCSTVMAAVFYLHIQRTTRDRFYRIYASGIPESWSFFCHSYKGKSKFPNINDQLKNKVNPKISILNTVMYNGVSNGWTSSS